MKIMAPAGDFERLRAVVKAGADEVYMGVEGFGARRFAKNFSVDEYVEAIDYAHRANVEVHLTFNTMTSDAELDGVYPTIKRLYEAGLDEVIVQDFGVAGWLQSEFPGLALCASTQLSPASARELNWYEKLGFRRAVLARETSLEEIASIRRQTKLEMEVFISGALCVGCSGKCYLSSFIGGRSGNRGMCAQPCRQRYRAERVGDDSVSSEGYFLSLKDQLQGREEIAKLLEIGVDSGKIEGRMKSPPYAYAVTRYYRDLIDTLSGVSRAKSEARLSIKRSEEEKNAAEAVGVPLDGAQEETRRREIAALFNRGYGDGFARARDPNILNARFASNMGVEVGRVEGSAVRLSQSLRNGDGVVFLDVDSHKLGGLNVGGIKRVDSYGMRRETLVEQAESGDLVRFREPIPDGAFTLYRTNDYALNKRIENALAQTRRREPISARLVAQIDKPLELTLSTPRASATTRSTEPLARAQKRGIDVESLRTSLDRFGETPFYLDQFEPIFDRDAFVPKSLLNQLRQNCAEALERNLLESYRRVLKKDAPKPYETSRPSPRETFREARARYETSGGRGDASKRDYRPFLAAKVRSQAQFDACKEFGVAKIYYDTVPVQYENRSRVQTSSEFAPLAGSPIEALRYEKLGRPYALDWFFNVGSARAVEYLRRKLPLATTIYLSPEISDAALDKLIARAKENETASSTTFGAPIYGRLLAMYTQKTLFGDSRVKLINFEDRRTLVEKNADRAQSPLGTFSANPDAAFDESTETVVPSGSSLYLNDALDLIDAIPWLVASGVGELRLDFTTEKFAEVSRVLERAASGGSGQFHTFSYGYTRDGVY